MPVPRAVHVTLLTRYFLQCATVDGAGDGGRFWTGGGGRSWLSSAVIGWKVGGAICNARLGVGGAVLGANMFILDGDFDGAFLPAFLPSFFSTVSPATSSSGGPTSSAAAPSVPFQASSATSEVLYLLTYLLTCWLGFRSRVSRVSRHHP